ncbi:MAG: hypothetical protein V7641_4565 [Blastocatellia bacterium]
MADQEHLDILNQGVEAWNAWREENPEIRRLDLSDANLYRANLSGANLSGANLIGANLRVANFSGADLSYMNLRGADLRYADLSGANLCRTDLSAANLSGTNLSGTNLSGAVLSGADLRAANLNYANLSSARIGYTTFGDNDLSMVIGLESMMFMWPSTIGIDTLYKSQGKIPESFLRGCGVPDDFIAFIPSHFGMQQAIQFYSCFISYSTKDEEFARRLYSRMRDEKLRVWFAPEDIKGGEKLHEQIERAIQLHDRLLIVLSDHSMQSEWVMTELRKARKQEIKQKRRKLFPIRLVDFETIRDWECPDGDSGKDLAVEIREYFIPDFSNWKDHDSFEAGFQRLLNDLRSAEL